jgi:hypothetical protein
VSFAKEGICGQDALPIEPLAGHPCASACGSLPAFVESSSFGNAAHQASVLSTACISASRPGVLFPKLPDELMRLTLGSRATIGSSSGRPSMSRKTLLESINTRTTRFLVCVLTVCAVGRCNGVRRSSTPKTSNLLRAEDTGKAGDAGNTVRSTASAITASLLRDERGTKSANNEDRISIAVSANGDSGSDDEVLVEYGSSTQNSNVSTQNGATTPPVTRDTAHIARKPSSPPNAEGRGRESPLLHTLPRASTTSVVTTNASTAAPVGNSDIHNVTNNVNDNDNPYGRPTTAYGHASYNNAHSFDLHQPRNNTDNVFDAGTSFASAHTSFGRGQDRTRWWNPFKAIKRAYKSVVRVVR